MEDKSSKILDKILGSIETINLKDGDAWNGIQEDLKDLVSDVVNEMPLAADPLNYCQKGICLLSETSVTSPLMLVDAISDCLYAFQQCLSNESGVSDLMLETGQELKETLESVSKDEMRMSDSNAADENSGTGEKESEITINDVAALLVLLEADDREALSRLKGMLDTILAGGNRSRISHEKLREAAMKTDAILSSKVTDPDRTIAEIGTLLDQAACAMDDEENEDEPSEPEVQNVAAAVSRRPDESEAPSGDKSESDSGQKEEIPRDATHSERLPEDADFDLLSQFVAESGDLISDAEEALLTLETDPEDGDAIGTVFRAFHTVKGVSAFLELNAISEMAHLAESLLSRVRDKEIRYSGGYADLALQSLDMIKQMITYVQDALGGAPLLRPEGYDDLVDLLRDPESAGISDETDLEEVAPRIGDILVASGKARRENVEALAASKSDKPIGVEMVKKKAAKVSDVAQALRTQDRMKGKQQVFETSIRVSTSRLDRLIDMVGELVIAHSMVAQDEVVVSGEQHQLLKKINQTGKIVRELQDLSMSMRMIPLKGTFKKMARLVRDVSP